MTEHQLALAFIAFAGACSTSSGDMAANDAAMPMSDAPTGPAVVLTGTPIVATAAMNVGEALLGTTTDGSFNQINGDPIFKPRGDGSGGILHTPQDMVKVGWVQAVNTNDIAANLAGWGVGSAALDASYSKRFMSMRAYQVDYYEDVDLTMLDKQAPAGATYFVSTIYYGHSYEALFSGSMSDLTVGVAEKLPTYSGSISVQTSANNLTETDVGRGLTPNNGQAIFASNSADVMANYSESAASVPIYLEYRLVPGAAEPAGTTIPWQATTKATFTIDEIDIFHNGSFSDLSNTAWAVTATCSVNNIIQGHDLAVWSSSNVTAGGSDVADGGAQPQDPDTSNSTLTYGRYSQNTFQTSFGVSDGVTLECDVSGDRTDKNPQVQLPPIKISGTVDTMYEGDGWSGNYDPGTNLDYLVHWHVAFSPA